MDRRQSLKTLLAGSAGVAAISVGVTSCKTETALDAKVAEGIYGRTPSEIKHDERVLSEVFFTEPELATIAVLCDLILPPSPTAGGANDAGVPEFIEFIVKDLPNHQLPLQGGLMWLNGEAVQRYNNTFTSLTDTEQKAILDDIAYPDKDGKTPQFEFGRKFFDRIRGLVLTGYYTTKMGFDDLGYVGNRPNLWDGPPQDVLDKHGLKYDENMIGKYVNHDKRETIAEWDDDGNLLT